MTAVFAPPLTRSSAEPVPVYAQSGTSALTHATRVQPPPAVDMSHHARNGATSGDGASHHVPLAAPATYVWIGLQLAAGLSLVPSPQVFSPPVHVPAWHV